MKNIIINQLLKKLDYKMLDLLKVSKNEKVFIKLQFS